MVFGLPLLKAYMMETQEAVWPRIVLSNTVLDLVFGHMAYYSDPLSSPHNEELLVDAEGLVFVDYLSYTILDDDYPRWDLADAHKDAIESALDRYGSDPKLRAKYSHVAAYHNHFCREHRDYEDYSDALMVQGYEPVPEFRTLCEAFPEPIDHAKERFRSGGPPKGRTGGG
jgi:hypothetical protein